MRTLIALAVCLIAAPAFADQPIPPGPEADVIAAANTLQLSKDPGELDKAERMLKLHADRAAHRLDAMEKFRPDIKPRIDRIRQFIGGGEVVDGLRVRLTVDKEAVRPGDVLTITTTLMNLTDKPLQVEVGYTTTGNYFVSGSAYAASFTPGATGQAAALPQRYSVGFCGTGATNIVETIPPMSTLSYSAKTTFGEIKNQHGGFAPIAEPEPGAAKPKLPTGLAFQYSYLPIDANGTLSLTVQRTNADLRPKVQPKPAPGPVGEGQLRPAIQLIEIGPAPKVDLDQPFWHGSMKSNTVDLKVFTKQVG